MTISKLEYDFLNEVTKIEDTDDFRIAALAFSKTDEVKQKIIDGIKNGELKTTDDVLELCEV